MRRRQRDNWYDTAQICMNGHVINSSMNSSSVHNAPFCDKCGAATINACQSCNAEIRGYYHCGVIGISYRRPAHCHACGAPYPWTEQSLAALRELAYETEGLGTEEKKLLAESFDDLLMDTVRTEVAVSRLKRFLPRMSREVGEAIRRILIDIASEAVQKQLGL